MNRIITVIVPVYNKLHLLKETIDSIFMQDYPEIELIITDDASPQYSKEFVEELIKDPPNNIKNIQIIHHETNIGTVKNLNNALKKSQGYYISALAGDDMYYESSTLSKLISTLKDGEIITGRLEDFSEDNDFTELRYPVSAFMSRYFPSQLLYGRTLIYGNHYPMPGVVFTKNLIELLGGFDERYTYIEDLPMWLKILRKNIRITISPYISVKYRVGGVTSNTEWAKILNQEVYNILMDESKYINENTLWGKFLTQGLAYYIHSSLNSVDIYHYGDKFSKKGINLVYYIFYRILRLSFYLTNHSRKINWSDKFMQIKRIFLKKLKQFFK